MADEISRWSEDAHVRSTYQSMGDELRTWVSALQNLRLDQADAVEARPGGRRGLELNVAPAAQNVGRDS